MKIGISTRLAIALSAFVLVTAVVVSFAWWLGLEALADDTSGIGIAAIEDVARQDLRREGEMVTEMLADALLNPVYFYDIYAIGQILESIADHRHVEFVLVFDADGLVIHDGQASIPRFGESLGEDVQGFDETESKVVGNRLVVTAPLMLDRERLGGVQLGFSLDPARSRVDEFSGAVRAANASEVRSRGRAIIVLVLGLALTAIISAAWVARGMSRPISRLLAYARDIEAGQFTSPTPEKNRSDELGELLAAFHSMATSIRQTTEEIRHQAYHDSLTGLPNRLYFRENLERMVRRQREDPGHKIALLFLDLDDFKAINDSLGHDRGDRVLVAFGRRLENTMRRALAETPITEHTVARLGGDEFTITLYGSDLHRYVDQVAREILDTLSQPVQIEGQRFPCSTSIGITLFPDDAYSADMLIKNADIAMYRAKLAGKNRFNRFTDYSGASDKRRDDIELAIRATMERREFGVVFQPVFGLKTGAVVGAEALLRAYGSDLEEMSPSVFIPVAEEMGVMPQIGRWMIDSSIREAAKWPADLWLSINLSPSQARDYAVANAIDDALTRHGVDPERIVVEISEAGFGAGFVAAKAVVDRLRKRGIRVWLDNFGHGMAGFERLHNRPLDGIKMDHNFLADIISDRDDVALTAMLDAARNLGLDVIAEGVESKEQQEMLVRCGCGYGQGFWLAHPCGAEEFRTQLCS